MAAKKFYLVQAVLRTKFGMSRARHRILTATDPIAAARECFNDLSATSKIPGKKYPERFDVYPERDRDTFMEEVGALTIDEDFDEDTKTPYDAVADMFEAKPIEVRL